VGIALPAIARDFHASVASMQWVVDGYTLPLAGLLLLGGVLGDVHGRRKVFMIGTVWFALASLACGLAPNTGFLIGARAMQGAGAALLVPGSLSILQASFAPDDRSKAIGAWSGLGGVATAVGPFLGGWLISAVSWRLIFFINLPAAVAVLAIAARHVPESRSPGPAAPLDAAGALTISLALAGLTYGLIAAPADGWTSPRVLASLVGGAALLAAFCVIEARSDHPMLPLTVFRSRQFSAANGVTFVVYGALGGALFLVPVVLQEVGGYRPREAGMAMLPITVIMLGLSARSAASPDRPAAADDRGRCSPRACRWYRCAAARTDPGAARRPRAGSGWRRTWRRSPPPRFHRAQEHSGIASAVNNDVARTAGSSRWPAPVLSPHRRRLAAPGR
jgi:EmrB/QacA subfamily drug resistance transporter